MSPNSLSTRNRWAIAGLLLVHILAGTLAACLGSSGQWSGIHVFAFMGLVCGQVILLGIWAGLARQAFSTKIIGWICGSSFITLVAAIGAKFPRRSEDILILVCIVFITAAMVSILFALIRRYRNVALTSNVGEIESYAAKPIRYGVKHLIGSTTLLSALLGIGQVIRSLGGESLGIGVLLTAFVVSGCILSWLVVWASLGQGPTLYRVPLVLALGCIFGLLPPYFLGGPSWRFLTWPALMAATEVIAILSLLFLRFCGYRLDYNVLNKV